MDKVAVLRELARAGMLNSYTQSIVRGLREEIDMWDFLHSIGAPDTVHAVAGTPIAKSTEEFSRQDIERLVNEHLIALGLDPAPIAKPETSDIDSFVVDQKWYRSLAIDRGDSYQLGIRMGLKPITAAILDQTGPAWIPLHRLISVGFKPYGLYNRPTQRFLIDAGDKV